MTTPEAKADRLVEALRENTSALHSVKRRYRWVLVLTAVLAFTLGYTVYTNYHDDVSACGNTNEIRAEIDDKFDSIGDFLDEIVSDTPENQEFIEVVRGDLTARDCSNIGWFS